ncbi:hypothetical protein [Paenibacillus polymyxa]|uniref:hypothetical protein n=1 Tax=Paenibacillus polymyxa TaxID=1406 RepID=UPI00287FC3C7|nr:hypothetical protein [Paenibacillus polymyxa]
MKNKMGKKLIDLADERYGRLTVIKEAERKGYTRRWVCQCDCDNIVTVAMSNLRTGHTTSCGCVQSEMASATNYKDLSGQVFGKLTVIERSQKKAKDRKVKWICKCECGEQAVVSSQHLQDGSTTSCGCNLSTATEVARRKLTEEYTVDGVVIPKLTQKLRSDSQTGHKGVHEVRNKNGTVSYMARIGVGGRSYYLGRFAKKEDAIAARKRGEEKYHKPILDNTPPAD